MIRKLAGLLALFLGVGLLLVFLSDRIGERNRIAEQGRTVLLPLVPLGRRDLTRGDRIELVYELPEIMAELRAGNWPDEGAITVTLDHCDVAQSARLSDDRPLADREVVMSYRFAPAGPGLWPSDRPRLSFGDSFFLVTEVPIADYIDARYAVLTVDRQGDSIVAGLADGDRMPLGVAP